MPRMPLTDLLTLFPSRPDSWLTEERPFSSFASRSLVPAGYVWPDVEAPPGGLRPIVLVQSSGAMGKTSAAKAMAAELKAPLVDLSKMRVGDDSLTGLIAKALGWVGAAEFTTELRTGQRTLFLDGLDEAQLLVGKESYLAFLANVLELVDGAGPGGQVIAFGRHDAIETAYLAILDSGLESEAIQLMPLSADQAFQLIDENLDSDPSYEIHRQHREPWQALRDAHFLDLGSALLGRQLTEDDWDLVSDFLGYAPVILAITENLRVDNPVAELAQLRSKGSVKTRIDRGRLLSRIVRNIMDREQNKVSKHLASALGLEDSQKPLLYNREEQVVRVIAATTGQSLTAAPPQSIPSDKKALYEEQIESWVHDHPFLRDRSFANVVFRDSVRAFVATSETVEIFGTKQSDLLSACGKPGPFFAHFVHALAPKVPTVEQEAAMVPEEINDDLIRSNGLASRIPMASYLQSGQNAYLMIGDIDNMIPTLTFFNDRSSGILVLESPLSHIYVHSDNAVVIDPSAGRVDLGPAVIIFADELEIGGKTLTSFPDREGPGAMLFAKSISHSSDLMVKAHGSRSLFVSCPNPSYQLRPYIVPRIDPSLLPLPAHSQQQLCVSLRRLLVAFRHGNPPCIYYEQFDKSIVGQNKLLAVLKDALTDLQIIRREGAMYTLSVENLSVYETNYTALNQEDWQVSLHQLSIEVLKRAELAELLS